MKHEAHEGRSPAGRAGSHRLLPIAGIAVAVVAVLAHVGLGAAGATLGGGSLVVGLGAVVAVKLLVVFGARRWWRDRWSRDAE